MCSRMRIRIGGLIELSGSTARIGLMRMTSQIRCAPGHYLIGHQLKAEGKTVHTHTHTHTHTQAPVLRCTLTRRQP
jgi:hypothetical protein